VESKAASHPLALRRSRDLGGTAGNELLTMLAAVVLVVLLVAEALTLLDLRLLLSVHMVIGLALIPPILLKLGSTGYRFVRYYTHSPTYRAKGAPLLPLRVIAPVLVALTIGIFVTGVALLILGHKSNELVFFHKLFFIVWAFFFGVHFLAYAPRTLRSLGGAWRGRPRTPGVGLRATLVATALGIGVALAISLAGVVAGWHHGGPH
jgi:hypothetical protein